MTSWFKAKLGRMRVSTLVLIVAFVALFWVQQSFQPDPMPEAPAPAVVPPGFVPDPNYTWVPRTNVRRPKEPVTTTTTTTTSPTTTSPTSPTETTPTTTVTDPDGLGPLPPSTETVTSTPATGSATVTATTSPGPAPTPTPLTPAG